MKKKVNNFVLLYFSIFAGFGSIFTLLGKHFDTIGLSQGQIGNIFSYSFIIMLISQPFWGYLADKYKKPKEIIYLLIIGSAVVFALMMNITNYISIVVLYSIAMLFISPIGPILDSILMRATDDFGSIRKWGSIGFGVAALVAGVSAQLLSSTDTLDLRIIFILYIVFSMISFFFITKIKMKDEKTSEKKAKLTITDFKKLIANKKYLLFLLTAFSIMGSLSFHGNFFPIYFTNMGQNLLMTTIVIFLFTISEAPIMNIMDKLIKKYQIEYCLLVSTILFSIRWFFYGSTNSPILILLTFALHGLTAGSFLVVVPKFINENVNENVKASAMTIYSAFALGIGSASANKFVAYLPEGNIALLYRAMGIATLFSVALSLILLKIGKGEKEKKISSILEN